MKLERLLCEQRGRPIDHREIFRILLLFFSRSNATENEKKTVAWPSTFSSALCRGHCGNYERTDAKARRSRRRNLHTVPDDYDDEDEENEEEEEDEEWKQIARIDQYRSLEWVFSLLFSI